MKRTLWFLGLFACIALLAWPLASLLRNPLPKGRIVMATGGAEGIYDELAQSYKAELSDYGVELVTRPEIGGFYTLKSLVVDVDGDVTAGIVKGGFVGGQQGRLATEDERNWHKKDVAGMRSLGRLFAEPMWIFTRAGESPPSLSDLIGKKLWLGERAFGSRCGVDDKNTMRRAGAVLSRRRVPSGRRQRVRNAPGCAPGAGEPRAPGADPLGWANIR